MPSGFAALGPADNRYAVCLQSLTRALAQALPHFSREMVSSRRALPSGSQVVGYPDGGTRTTMGCMLVLLFKLTAVLVTADLHLLDFAPLFFVPWAARGVRSVLKPSGALESVNYTVAYLASDIEVPRCTFRGVFSFKDVSDIVGGQRRPLPRHLLPRRSPHLIYRHPQRGCRAPV